MPPMIRPSVYGWPIVAACSATTVLVALSLRYNGITSVEMPPAAGADRVREYDLGRGPVRLRIFADNYQFMLFDGEPNPFDAFPEIDEATIQRGWIRNEHAIWFFTHADCNDHRLDVCLMDHYEPDRFATRQTVHNLRLSRGALFYFNAPGHQRFRVAPGDYMVYCRAYNLGEEDPEGMVTMTDEEFFRHTEWERYELILVPGVSTHEGEF